MGMEDFESGVAAWFKRRNLDRKAAAIIAFSGGPDSTALLAVLQALDAGPLKAAYIDHGIRSPEERKSERELVVANTDALGVELVVHEVPEGSIAAFARDKGIGIEAAARDFRKKTLVSMAKALGLGRIYVGHTRDDDLEGLFMRFIRGSGTAGLCGLRAVNGLFARPLLDTGRVEIEAYLRLRNLVASRDSTNSDERILRNRVRRRVLPLLDAEFPGWRSGLRRTARRIALDDEALTLLSVPGMPAKDRDGALVVRREIYHAMPEGLQFRILAKAIDDLVEEGSCPEFPGGRVPARMLEEILARVAGNRPFSGHGLRVSQDGAFLKIEPSLDLDEGGGYFIVLNESDIGFERSFPGGHISLGWTDDLDNVGVPEGSFDFPLIVRTRRPGDFIDLSPARRAVDGLVAGWGFEPRFRAKVAVVQDRRGILAVLGAAVPRGKDVFRRVSSGALAGRRLFLRLKGA